MAVQKVQSRTNKANDRISVVLEYVSLIGIVAHCGFVPLFYFGLDVPTMAFFNLGSVAAWVAARAVNRRGYTNLAVTLVAIEVTAHAVAAVLIVGWASGFHYFLLPLVALLLFNDRARVSVLIATCIGILAVYLSLRVVADSNPLAMDLVLLRWLEIANIAVPFGALVTIVFYFRLGSVDAERRMEYLAMTDVLTGLPNRRRIRDLLELECVRYSRGKRSFGVLLADLDHFKRINDEHGHEGGDEVLTEVAVLLRQNLRAQDVPARWGGEEFLVFLPETDSVGALIIAEKVRAAIESHRFEYNGKTIALTVTLGVTCYSEDITLDECIREADDALYRGKYSGRNRADAITSTRNVARAAPDSP